MKEEAQQGKSHLSLKKGTDPFKPFFPQRKQVDVIHSLHIHLHIPHALNLVPSFAPLVLTSILAGAVGDARPAVSPLDKLQSKLRIVFYTRSTLGQSHRKPSFLIAALL